MHAIVEFEVPDGELCLVDVIPERIQRRVVDAAILRQLTV